MENVNMILKEQGLTKQQLAKRMGISRENLYRILNGNPTLDNIKKVANALNVPIWKLFTSNGSSLFGIVVYNEISYTINSKKDLENLLEQIE
ncbi:helix-turn-helix transcriptional regulator [uncultured Draconibacterium sp.]|uniref:helix-turn-helix domain-containing protein n=1 Tax=uncultured Draconibacterium sp. TaxID=1573823 RepID=UPI0025EEB47E|nr:helix-turn-helix transcriptional regulator [uncultured Draconibacterium sp.]